MSKLAVRANQVLATVHRSQVPGPGKHRACPKCQRQQNWWMKMVQGIIMLIIMIIVCWDQGASSSAKCFTWNKKLIWTCSSEPCLWTVRAPQVPLLCQVSYLSHRFKCQEPLPTEWIDRKKYYDVSKLVSYPFGIMWFIIPGIMNLFLSGIKMLKGMVMWKLQVGNIISTAAENSRYKFYLFWSSIPISHPVCHLPRKNMKF